MSDDVDLSVLDELDVVLGGRHETVTLLGEFVENARTLVRAVAGEAEPGERTDGHRAAHTLATSATMMGALALGRTSRAIEDALADGVLPEPAVRAELDRLLESARSIWTEAGRLPASGAR